MVSSGGGSDIPSTNRSCTIQQDTSRTRTRLSSCPKLLEAATEDVDDGRDAVASTASVACIFTTGPDTRPLLAHPSLLCRCSPLCMYAYVVRTVEHLHAGQACRTYFRYHISAQSGRVIDSTRISPHVSLRAQFHWQRNMIK